MLQFWKKTGHTEKKRSNSTPSVKSTPPSSPVANGYGPFTKSNSLETRSGPLASFDDEGLCDIGETDTPKERSRLSKTLTEVLTDKSALDYFIQYLESKNALSYIHCWLDIKQFKSQAPDCKKSEDEESSPCPKVDHDSLSVSTDCDSFTADCSSLFDYATVSEGKSEAKNCDKTKLDDNSVCDRVSSDTSLKFNSDKLENKCSEINGDESVSEKVSQSTIEDALKIFKRYVALEAAETVKCPEEIRKEIIENICDVEPSCFEKVEKFLCEVLDRDYFQAFLGSDYFCKHQIDVLTSGNIVLDDILYNETALFYFMEFLEQENNRNLLEFWLAATNFQQQLHDQKEFLDPIEAQNDAIVLYDKYFSLQAHCPLGFGDKIRFAVEQNICGEHGVMLDCFHLPLKIIEQVLEKNYLKTFIASQLFYKYLSELINTVQMIDYPSILNGNRCLPSDCSSEKSFSTNSTFLAMENPNRSVSKRRDRKTDMNIDTRQLYDPDSLWKRKKHRLSFGRVTELGKFEADYEPEPNKKSEWKLKNAFKKFVSLDEDKKKEEMAWQVAEMIVKDITSITLNEQKPFHS